jgi:hypothetical protein
MPGPTILRLPFLALGTALIVAACGSSAATTGPNATAGQTRAPATQAPASAGAQSEAPSAAATTPDACKLITTADIETFLGEKAAPPSGGLNVTGSDPSDCDWQQADTSAGILHLVQLQVFNSPTYLKRDGYQPTEIIGDVAIPGASEAFSIDEGNGVGINMVVGPNRAVLHFTPGGKADPKPSLPALTVLATKLAAAMPH